MADEISDEMLERVFEGIPDLDKDEATELVAEAMKLMNDRPVQMLASLIGCRVGMTVHQGEPQLAVSIEIVGRRLEGDPMKVNMEKLELVFPPEEVPNFEMFVQKAREGLVQIAAMECESGGENGPGLT